MIRNAKEFFATKQSELAAAVKAKRLALGRAVLDGYTGTPTQENEVKRLDRARRELAEVEAQQLDLTVAIEAWKSGHPGTTP